MSNWRCSTLIRPAIGRCFVLVLTTVTLLVAAPAHASEGSPTQPRLTEAQAVQRALENPALADLRAGWTGEAKADGLARTRWQNPSLSYTREQLLGSDVVGEDYLTLSQPFDISGRKSLARRAAKERGRAAVHQADAVVVEFKAEVRRRFYRLLLAQEREQALDAWKQRVQARLEAVVKREQAGDAAAYDRVRLQQELTSVDARLQREHAAEAKAWALLRALIDGPQTDSRRPTRASVPRLEGQVVPSPPPNAKQQVVDATAAQPGARARQAEARALRLDTRATSRWWVPNPSIGGGYKGVDIVGGGRAHGFVFMFSVPLPVLDRKRADRTRVAARAQSLRAETSLAATEARAQADGLWEEVALLSSAARTMTRVGRKQSAELIRAAEAGYRGGEIGVMELLDAYRSATDTDLTALDLAMDARFAQIDLDQLTEVQS